MKRACLSLLFVTGLSLAGSARAVEVLNREDVARGASIGFCTLLESAQAVTYDDGGFYGLSGHRIVAVILPTVEGGNIYVWNPRTPGFHFAASIYGAFGGRLHVEPYASIIAGAVAPLFVGERPAAPSSTRRNSWDSPSKSETWRFLRQARRGLGISRRAFVLWLGVAALFSLLLLAALTVMVTKLLTTISDIAIRHRLVSHANKALGAIKGGTR